MTTVQPRPHRTLLPPHPQLDSIPAHAYDELEDEKQRDERAVAARLGLARWGYRPEGPHPVIAGLAWGVNALTTPEDRHLLLELAPSVRVTTEDTTCSERDRWALTARVGDLVRLASPPHHRSRRTRPVRGADRDRSGVGRLPVQRARCCGRTGGGALHP